MAKYTVEWCELKKEGETNGRPWKIMNMTLKDEAGTVHNDVSTFDPVQPGQEIEGSIEMKGNYKNFKRAMDKPNFMKKKDDSIIKAMDKKEHSIEKFQSSKEESIKLASAQRDSVLITVQRMAQYKQGEFWTDQEIQDEVIKWRNWFLLNTEFNNPPPFE